MIIVGLFVIIIAIMLVSGLRWDGRARAARAAAASSADLAPPAAVATSPVADAPPRAGVWRTVVTRLWRSGSDATDPGAFTDWLTALVAASAANQAQVATFRAALATHNRDEVRSLHGQLRSFCDALGVDERWLHDGSLDARPILYHTLRESVALFAVALVIGTSRADEVARFRAYRQWLDAPDRLDQRGFGRRLFAALERHGIAAWPEDLHAAAEPQRRAYLNRAIPEHAAAHPAPFDAALRDALAGAPTAIPDPR